MPLNNMAYRLRGGRRWRRFVLVCVLLGAATATAFVFTQLSSGEHRLASWWPPAGLAASAAVIAKRHELALVLVVVLLSTAAASLTAQRPLVVAIAGAIGVTVQCWLVRYFAVDKKDRPRLFTLHDVTRFVGGVMLGGVAVGVAVLLARLLTSDVLSALGAAVQVAAGTTSAVLLIVPFFLISRRRNSAPIARAVTWSSAATLLATAIAFWPSQAQGLAFLPLPFLAWAAFSIPMPWALLQVIGVNAAALLSTSLSGGPFVAANTPIGATLMIEFYVVVSTSMCLFIAAVRNERDSAAEQRSAAAALSRQAFDQAGNGFVVLRDTEYGTFDVLDINATAATLVPRSLERRGGHYTVVPGGRLHHLCLEVQDSHSKSEARWAETAPVGVVAEELADTVNDRVLLVTIVDLSAIEAAQHAADAQLQQERETTERLRLTNESHDLFVASVTHELRTPLTSIIGYTDRALDLADDDELRHYLGIVQRNAERLLTLVQDVLDTTQPRAPKSSHGIVDLSRVINESIADVGLLARTREQELTYEVEYGLIAWGNESELRQSLINLLGNAIKFSHLNSSVQVNASQLDGIVTIEISDSGPGMSEDEIEHAFDRFYRSSSAVKHGIPGTGLGLGNAREAIEANNGTLVLAGNMPNGLIARIRVPSHGG